MHCASHILNSNLNDSCCLRTDNGSHEDIVFCCTDARTSRRTCVQPSGKLGPIQYVAQHARSNILEQGSRAWRSQSDVVVSVNYAKVPRRISAKRPFVEQTNNAPNLHIREMLLLYANGVVHYTYVGKLTRVSA